MSECLSPQPVQPPRQSTATEVAELFVDVLVPRRFRHGFTYRVPDELRLALHIGSEVEVPFGRTRLLGVAVAFSHLPPAQSARAAIRAVGKVLDDGEPTVPIDLLELSRLVSDHYLAPWGQCLRLIVPPLLL